MQDTDKILSNYPIHETSMIWDEAGFIPPCFFRNIIEVLHTINSYDIENINGTDVIADLININEKTVSGCSEYIFTNPEKMYSFAGEMKITAENMSDKEIAEKILFRLINEYIGDNRSLSKKEVIMEIFSRFSTCIA